MHITNTMSHACAAALHFARLRSRFFFALVALLALCAVLFETGVFPLRARPEFLNVHPPRIGVAEKTKPILPFKTRGDLIAQLERDRFKRGAELGVQRGIFAEETLSKWTSAQQYVLVDLWGSQQNYRDVANVANDTHEAYKNEALRRTRPFADLGVDVQVCQGLTLQCVMRFEDEHFDYIYVDARHDYKGVSEDIQGWWPKLRPGGIMAGHDYVTNDDGPRQSGQDWSVNYDGTIDSAGRAVKGAVDDFAEKNGLQIVLSYREPRWNTWAVRKPHKGVNANETA